jgi:hypothetical protein
MHTSRLRPVTLAALLLVVAAVPAAAREDAPKTVVNDMAAKRSLLGRHMLSLQWVSWDRFGVATVADRGGTLYVTGEQRNGTDFVKIDGVIARIDAKEFSFRGTIVTQVSHINEGKPCTRDGEFTFAIKAGRKYWRLQQMENPCDVATDYVDIYFRRR